MPIELMRSMSIAMGPVKGADFRTRADRGRYRRRGRPSGRQWFAGVDSAAMSPDPSPHHAWRRNRRIIALLLTVWFVVTFVVAWFARALSFNFFGWPFSFWVAAQGALIVYVAIVWFYAWYMHRVDAPPESGAQ